MAQSITNGFGLAGAEVLYFVLQPNETGLTGSHQKGEIHVRRSQIGGLLPDLRGHGQTVDRELSLVHAAFAEPGVCAFTHFGGRATPEDRLRKFPSHWRADWEAGDVLVLVQLPGQLAAVLYHHKRGEQVPLNLAAVATGSSHGRYFLPVARLA